MFFTAFGKKNYDKNLKTTAIYKMLLPLIQAENSDISSSETNNEGL